MSTFPITELSIITASFNAETTIHSCLDSVKNQGCDVEHIIRDGGSTDQTLDIVKEYTNRKGTVVSEPDNGFYDAINKGIEIAKGDIIGILNADDYYPSADTLAWVQKAFEDPKVGACYGDLHYVEARNTDKVVRNWRSGGFDPKKFYWGWMPPHPTFFVRRSVYEQFGKFDLELGSAADYEIMLRFMVRYKVNAAYIPKVLVKMRTGGMSNASLMNRLKANYYDRKAWEIQWPDTISMDIGNETCTQDWTVDEKMKTIHRHRIVRSTPFNDPDHCYPADCYPDESCGRDFRKKGACGFPFPGWEG